MMAIKRVIVLDSSPLGLLFQKPSYPRADECRSWLERHVAANVDVIVPEIANYELRRELIRLGKHRALNALAAFNNVSGRFLPITSASLDLAAELWAEARKQGKPTADVHALDGDVILAAQVLTEGFQPGRFVVATSNVSHLSQFVPAAMWDQI
jgi:predicted nucleic acid-binding protein